MKTIVVSAVNLRKGGTLTILRQCLSYLSAVAKEKNYRIVAIVHKKELAYYPNIEYIEKPKVIRSWARRLWCEYVTMHALSEKLKPVDLWLSLHDTSPRVKARRQAVYCQTSFPFMKPRMVDLKYDYKTFLFSLFTRFAYRINIRANAYLVVQAEWLRQGFSEMFRFPERRIVVAPPERKALPVIETGCEGKERFTFIYPATPDCHKNFECLCEAARLLEQEWGKGRFHVVLTLTGEENRYARMLKKRFGATDAIGFVGFLSQEKLIEWYRKADCLVFPSRVETWGLPISEFSVTDKPMLLADLPYAHETATGASKVQFFRYDRPDELKEKMKRLCEGHVEDFAPLPSKMISEPFSADWGSLFDRLLDISR